MPGSRGGGASSSGWPGGPQPGPGGGQGSGRGLPGLLLERLWTSYGQVRLPIFRAHLRSPNRKAGPLTRANGPDPTSRERTPLVWPPCAPVCPEAESWALCGLVCPFRAWAGRAGPTFFPKTCTRREKARRRSCAQRVWEFRSALRTFFDARFRIPGHRARTRPRRGSQPTTGRPLGWLRCLCESGSRGRA